MNDALMDLGQTVFTGPWSTVWPVLAMPLLAALFLGLTLRRIEALWSAPGLQASAAAIAACLPGFVIFSLALFALRSASAFSPETWRCYVKLFGPLVIAASFFVRASLLLYGRHAEMCKLLRTVRDPSARLAKLGEELGVPVRELASSVPVCVVAGLVRPCVVISSGAVAHLEDWALRAALLHERAHIRNWDNLRAAALSFVGDCAPFGTRKAFAIYQTGREILADREAARHVNGVDLAALLVDFARNTTPIPLTQPFAQPKGLEQRVRLLLEDTRPAAEPVRSVFPIFVYFAFAAALGLYPLAAKAIDKLIFHCAP